MGGPAAAGGCGSAERGSAPALGGEGSGVGRRGSRVGSGGAPLGQKVSAEPLPSARLCVSPAGCRLCAEALTSGVESPLFCRQRASQLRMLMGTWIQGEPQTGNPDFSCGTPSTAGPFEVLASFIL